MSPESLEGGKGRPRAALRAVCTTAKHAGGFTPEPSSQLRAHNSPPLCTYLSTSVFQVEGITATVGVLRRHLSRSRAGSAPSQRKSAKPERENRSAPPLSGAARHGRNRQPLPEGDPAWPPRVLPGRCAPAPRNAPAVPRADPAPQSTAASAPRTEANNVQKRCPFEINTLPAKALTARTSENERASGN